VGKEGGRFVPSELGMVVTDLLLESFDDIFDVSYTARMEEELDEIEEGNSTGAPPLRNSTSASTAT